MGRGNSSMWLIENLIKCGAGESLIEMDCSAEITCRLGSFPAATSSSAQYTKVCGIHMYA